MERKKKGFSGSSRQTSYEDIIELPHHVSSRHPQMSMLDRAAQFSPFAALTGYGDAVREKARFTEESLQKKGPSSQKKSGPGSTIRCGRSALPPERAKIRGYGSFTSCRMRKRPGALTGRQPAGFGKLILARSRSFWRMERGFR